MRPLFRFLKFREVSALVVIVGEGRLGEFVARLSPTVVGHLYCRLVALRFLARDRFDGVRFERAYTTQLADRFRLDVPVVVHQEMREDATRVRFIAEWTRKIVPLAAAELEALRQLGYAE